MGPTWGPPGPCRSQMGPMLAPWTLLSGMVTPAQDHTWSPCVLQILIYISYTMISLFSRGRRALSFPERSVTSVPPLPFTGAVTHLNVRNVNVKFEWTKCQCHIYFSAMGAVPQNPEGSRALQNHGVPESLAVSTPAWSRRHPQQVSGTLFARVMGIYSPIPADT